MPANSQSCYPLTVTDNANRYLITCDALSTTRETYASPVLEQAFKDFGLPTTIRTDNDVPFAGGNG